MKNHIKSIKTFSLAALLLCLVAFTLTRSMLGLQEALWAVEECVLTSRLISAKTPENGDIDRFEDEFAEGMQDHWAESGNKGTMLDVIKSWDHETYNFGGFYQLSSGERVRFERLADHESESRQAEIERWKASDENKGASTRPVVYQPYDIESAAFPGRKHELLLADGAIRYGNFDYYTKEGWVLASPDFDLTMDARTLDSKAVRLGERWVGAGATPEGVFFALRTAAAQHKTRVPVIGWEVSSRVAAAAMAIIAVYVAIIFAHSLLGMRDQQTTLEEPWLAIPSFEGRNTLEKALSGFLAAIGIAALAIATLLPVVTILALRGVVHGVLFWCTAALVLPLAGVSLISIIQMARSGTIGRFVANRPDGPSFHEAPGTPS